jgi:hypothetical protein
MVEPRQLALIHAEIDGELDAEQRAELARCVLADPNVRAVREDLRRLCSALDGLVPVEPPAQMRESVLAALPQSSFRPRQSFVPRWRYAAVIAGMLAAGVLVLQTLRAPETASSDAAGTMASVPAPTIIDTVRLGSGPVSGRVSLYRDPKGVGLEFELAASVPVDVLISSGGHTLQVKGLGGPNNPVGSRTSVPLPDFGTGGQTVDLTFLMAGRRVGGATLRSSGSS